eukprot:64591_1
MRDLPFESFYNKYKLSNKQIKQIVDEIKPLSVDNNTQEFKSSVADGYNISHKNDDCKNNMEQIENVKIGCLGEFINWLQNDNSTKMYPMHFKVLESTLHDQFDEHDFEIENLLDDLDDEDNSEIMVALGQDDNCSNDYMKYIDELKKTLVTDNNIQLTKIWVICHDYDDQNNTTALDKMKNMKETHEKKTNDAIVVNSGTKEENNVLTKTSPQSVAQDNALIFDENNTTALENEIISNEKRYKILLNDTSV